MPNPKGFDPHDVENLTSYTLGIHHATIPRRRDGGPSGGEMGMIGEVALRIAAEMNDHVFRYFAPPEIGLIQISGEELFHAGVKNADETVGKTQQDHAHALLVIATKMQSRRDYDKIDRP